MPGSATSLNHHVRALLGRARLVYWNDAGPSGALQALQNRLDGPLAVEVPGPAPLAGLVGLLAPAGVVVAEHGDAELHLTDPGAPTAPLGGEPGDGRRRVVAADLGRAVALAELSDETIAGAEDAPAPPPDVADRVAALVAEGHQPEAVRRALVADAGTEPLSHALEELALDADALRTIGCLADLRTLLREHPHAGAEPIAEEVEQLAAFAPQARELDARVRLRGGELAGIGPAGATRALAVLDAVRALDTAAIARRPADLEAELRYWRGVAQDPTLPRASRGVAETVARGCERLLAHDPRA